MIERRERVLIVCSGPSVTGPEVSRLTAQAAACGAWILTVNGALDHTESAEAWFTLDPSAENRARWARLRSGVRYFAALPEPFPYFVPQHVTRLRRVEGDGFLRAKDGLSDDPAAVHTGNSGYGALGLAYHAQAQRVAFLGLDGRPGAYFWGGTGPRGKLDHIPALFASALPQLIARGMKVMNGSPASTVRCFDRLTPADAVSWLSAF